MFNVNRKKGYGRVSTSEDATSSEGENCEKSTSSDPFDSTESLCKILLLIIVISLATAFTFAVFIIFLSSSFSESLFNPPESSESNSILSSVLTALNQSHSFYDEKLLIFAKSHMDEVFKSQDATQTAMQQISSSLQENNAMLQYLISDDEMLKTRIKNIDMGVQKLASIDYTSHSATSAEIRAEKMVASVKAITWEHAGYAGCASRKWRKIGTAGSLKEAKGLMLSDWLCNSDQSMLFYSNYSYTSSWGVRCTTAEHLEDCMEENTNWKKYIVHFISGSNLSLDAPEEFSMDWLPKPETFIVWPNDHEAWDPANVSDGGPHDKGVTYGMMNSGTHFTNAMVRLNCARIPNKYTQHTFKHGHWFPRFVQTVSKRQPFIITVKDPLTWMKSMCNKSHELKTLRSAVNKPCREKVFLPWKFRGKKYPNLAEVWQEYFKLAIYEYLHGSHKLMFIRYEDLLNDPQKTMERVCKHLGRKLLKMDVKIRENRSGFSTLGFEDQLEKYANPGYRYADWTRQDLAKLKQIIEPRIIEYFGYQFDYSIEYFPQHHFSPP